MSTSNVRLWVGRILSALPTLFLIFDSVIHIMKPPVLLTGYLGGAVATNLRAGGPLFSNVLIPVYIGVMLWGGLYLRDDKVRSVFPVRG